MSDLVLDTQIRDWVLLPLTVVMILIGILRFLITKMAKSEPNVDMKVLREGQLMIRARSLRGAGNYLSARAVRMRKHYFCNEENGVLVGSKDAPPSGGGAAAMFSDPSMAMDMMKKNLGMIVPQTLTFAWVNFFFSGFVTAKVPFPLTQRFRGMLQNGIDLSSVNVSYVSSRSWYFLNLLGLRGFFSLILGEENGPRHPPKNIKTKTADGDKETLNSATDDAQKLMQSQMAMQMGGMGADPAKMLASEKDSLELMQHHWLTPRCEKRAVEILRARLKAP